VTRVKRETLGENYEAEPGRLRPFTLHDASLSAHMHAAVHNVNLRSGDAIDVACVLNNVVGCAAFKLPKIFDKGVLALQ
jgi:hypothetical protein